MLWMSVEELETKKKEDRNERSVAMNCAICVQWQSLNGKHICINGKNGFTHIFGKHSSKQKSGNPKEECCAFHVPLIKIEMQHDNNFVLFEN